LAAIIEACGGTSPASPSSAASLPVVNGTLNANTITVTVEASSPLATVGGMAFVQAGGTAVLAARTGQSSFTALSAMCTHQGCAITAYSGSTFVCPCHGAQFSTNGQVLSGPAASNLQVYNTQFVSNVLTIS
jgi:cytochrome b6-f complex iron-sulfur subunit